MVKFNVRRPTPATVIALIALFVALGGTGYAVSKIDGANLKARSVTHKKIKRNTLTGAEINEDKLSVLRPCFVGSVHGFARIRAAANFPSTFTDDPNVIDIPYHCDGGKVFARRVEEGVYHVHFEPTVGAFGFANAEGGGFASATGVQDAAAPGEDKFTFEVRVRSGENLKQSIDVPFEVMVP